MAVSYYYNTGFCVPMHSVILVIFQIGVVAQVCVTDIYCLCNCMYIHTLYDCISECCVLHSLLYLCYV